MAPRPPLSSYTVGWISALPIELAAAVEMFDEHFQDLPPEQDDPNLYTLGRMDHHHVVLTCLPAGRAGTTSAATVAMYMKSRFRSLRFYLMVGVGGGVPSEDSDVRLGDVVVSQPHMGHGGVVQYDFGKETTSGFQRTGLLSTPPTLLLHALSTLQANHYRGKNNLPSYLARYDHLPDFARDKAGPDLLFESVYDHVREVGNRSCQRCDKTRLVERDPRESEGIRVHYGTIASGNQVMKNGRSRDRLKKEIEDILCVEMEAAGIVDDNIRCLVIRGICDYADSHKNDRWHAPAAAVAAACAREILSVIPGPEVDEAATVEEALQSMSMSGHIPQPNFKNRTPPPPPPPGQSGSRYTDSSNDAAAASSIFNIPPNSDIWMENNPPDGRLLLIQGAKNTDGSDTIALSTLTIKSGSPFQPQPAVDLGHGAPYRVNLTGGYPQLERLDTDSVPWPPMAIRIAQLALSLPGRVYNLAPTPETGRMFAALDANLFTPDAEHPWRGIWTAGSKFILFHQATPRYLEGILLTGDGSMRPGDGSMRPGDRLLVVEDLFAGLKGGMLSRPHTQTRSSFRASFSFYQPRMGRTEVSGTIEVVNQNRMALRLDIHQDAETTFWRLWPAKDPIQ